MNTSQVPRPDRGPESQNGAGNDPIDAAHGESEPTLWGEQLPWVDDAPPAATSVSAVVNAGLEPATPPTAVRARSVDARIYLTDAPVPPGDQPKKRHRVRFVLGAVVASTGIIAVMAMLTGHSDSDRRPEVLPSLDIAAGRESEQTSATDAAASSLAAQSTPAGGRSTADSDPTSTPTGSPTANAIADRNSHTAAPRRTAGTPTPSDTTARSSAPQQPYVIKATAVLNPGESRHSGKASLTMRSDGNLAVIDERGRTRWTSHTSGSGLRTVFQDDGNLAVYDTLGNVRWSSRTDGHPGALLVLMPDGNVRIELGNSILWQTDTGH
jgi:hypothetical protein